ncbi:unnamed protein product [Lymnaea stagnalis]|uniref:AD domain-containing protein n=1 Tax=Lymnaea stagnalis TaxID=6523 RepID=A0AAV2HVC4_LYMST
MESGEITDKDSLHPIFTKDSQEWMKLVNNEVRACTEDGQEFTGYVYTIDPVSECVVLVSPSEESKPQNISMKLLMGPSVRSIEVISGTTNMIKSQFEHLFRPVAEETFTNEEMKIRMQRLKSWLEQNRLPVATGGMDGQFLTIADALTIRPPYTENSCLSTNEIILSRIQGLIRSMP